MGKRAIVWTVVVLAVAAAAVFAYFKLRAAPEAEIKFETAAVDRGPVSAHITSSGTLSALVTVQVGSQVSGRIDKLFADFNSVVKKGEVVAKIDPLMFEAEVRKARANVMAASGNLTRTKAEAENASRQYARTKELRAAGLVSQSELEAAESASLAANAQVEATKGSVEQARAALHQSEINLAFTTIRSPIDGVVISRSVDVGQTVAASLSAPTLFTIAEDLRKMQVDTYVAEADVGKLKPGTAATFTVDAYPGRRFKGLVREIRNAPQTVQNVVTYDAVIDVDNSALELKPGMTATVTIVVAERDSVLRVPNSALRFRPPSDVAPSASFARSARPGRSADPPGSSSADPPGPGPDGGAPDPDAGAKPSFDRSTRADWKTVWIPDGATAKPVRIRAGITDGTTTEILEGDLAEGAQVIVSSSGGGAAAPASSVRPSSPGQSPGQSPGRRMF